MLDVEYSNFKEDTIKGIREDEEQYAKLQEEIHALEAEIEAEREARALKDTPTTTEAQKPTEAFEPAKIENGTSSTPQPTEPARAASNKASTPIPQAQPLQVPFDRALPPPSPQRSDYGPVPEQQGFVAGPLPHNARTLPHLPGLSPMHPPLDPHAPHQRTPSGSASGHGSPLSYPAQPQPQYQQYPPYNQAQHPWHPQPAYPQRQSPHAGAHYYQNAPPYQGLPPATTPIPPQHQYYAQTAPVNLYARGQQQQQQWQVPVHYPPHVRPASAGTTPVQRKDGTPSHPNAFGSSTPWSYRREHSNLADLRLTSPERPLDRDVSPLSDVESLGLVAQTKGNAPKSKLKSKKQESAPQKRPESRGTRHTRAGSSASSTIDRSSRSQSLASFASDSRPAPGKKIRSSRKIKPEPTSTPAPFPSDSEIQRSSGRRRTRGDTFTAHDAPARLNLKRKRDSVQDSSPIPSSPPYQRTRRQRSLQDPDLVSVSKTFSRVASQLLQRVTEHKFAGIFAKALSERDAPGYKNLILRPQDLKSIKAAVTRGGKAAIAAIEEVEQETGETPITVKKSEDFVPPKGIVNMDQLEMELMRMFANAIMFNPLPDAERGLGPRRSLRLSATPSQTGELGYAGSEEGGIVQDAREMCEDVVNLIQTFKAAEQDRMDVDQA